MRGRACYGGDTENHAIGQSLELLRATWSSGTFVAPFFPFFKAENQRGTSTYRTVSKFPTDTNESMLCRSHDGYVPTTSTSLPPRVIFSNDPLFRLCRLLMRIESILLGFYR